MLACSSDKPMDWIQTVGLKPIQSHHIRQSTPFKTFTCNLHEYNKLQIQARDFSLGHVCLGILCLVQRGFISAVY